VGTAIQAISTAADSRKVKSATRWIDENGDATSGLVAGAFGDTLKTRIEKVKYIDNEIKIYKKEEEKKARKKRTVHADSDLSEFLQ